MPGKVITRSISWQFKVTLIHFVRIDTLYNTYCVRSYRNALLTTLIFCHIMYVVVMLYYTA